MTRHTHGAPIARLHRDFDRMPFLRQRKAMVPRALAIHAMIVFYITGLATGVTLGAWLL